MVRLRDGRPASGGVLTDELAVVYEPLAVAAGLSAVRMALVKNGPSAAAASSLLSGKRKCR